MKHYTIEHFGCLIAIQWHKAKEGVYLILLHRGEVAEEIRYGFLHFE